MRVVFVAVAVLMLAGCYPSPVQPNDVDESRLAALAAEPVLSGGQQHPAEPNNTSANANALRAYVSVTQDWSTGGGSETWGLTQELLTELRDQAWVVVAQNCRGRDSGLISGEFVALKQLDDFTAGMYITVDADGAVLEAYAPFHEEKSNPWGALDEQEGGCLDSPEEPTEDSDTDIRTPVGLFYLRDE